MTELKALLVYNVIEDIKEFGKPAFMYNYHYGLKQINALDTENLWDMELANLHKQKQGLVTKQAKKIVKIGGKRWECVIWIVRPEDSNGNIDEKEFLKMTSTICDPLAMSIGYMVSGYCYLQFTKPM